MSTPKNTVNRSDRDKTIITTSVTAGPYRFNSFLDMHRRHLIIALLATILTFGFLGIESCRKVEKVEKEQKTSVDSLVGRWLSQQSYGQNSIDYYVTFKKGGKVVEQYVYTEGNNREVMSRQGTFAVKDRKIDFTWDRNSMKFTFNDFAQNNMPQQQREGIIANQKASFQENTSCVILSLTKDRMVLGDPLHTNSAAISFIRK